MTSPSERLMALLDEDPTLIRKALRIMVDKNRTAHFISRSETAAAMSDIAAKSERWPTLSRKQSNYVIGVMKEHAKHFIEDVEALARKEQAGEVYEAQPEPEIPAEFRVTASSSNPIWGAF